MAIVNGFWRWLAIVLMLAPAAFAQPSGLAETIQPPPKTPQDEQNGPAPVDPAAALRAKVAQLMIVVLEGNNSPTSGDRYVLEHYTPGGVILTSLTQPTDAVAYISQVRQIADPRGLPLLVGVDLYSLATQPRNPMRAFVQLPSPLSLAAADRPAAVAKVAGLLADHLTLMGFSMHVGPSLELASTLPDVDGSIYRFGNDPALAARAGKTIVETLLARGVLPMPTGFPGGGANRKGSGPAVLLTPPTVLEEQDLKPYIAAIAAGAPLMHVSGTVAPMLDSSQVPSCLSAKVMRELLRDKLGFNGVIVAGPIDGPDVVREHDAADAAIAAFAAGADMLSWITSRQTMVRAVDRVVDAVQTGALPQAVIDQAYTRVEAMKNAQKPPAQPVKEKNAARLSKKKEYPEATYEVERCAITLVQNRGDILPLNKDKDMPIGVTGIVGVEPLHDALEEYIKPVSQQVITTAMHAHRIHDFEIDRVTRHIRGIRTVICILSDALPSTSQAELVEAIQKQGVRVVVLLLGYPRDLAALAAADAIVVTYADEQSFSQTLRAVAESLVGLAAINIYPPVRPLTTTVGKKERFNVFDLVHSPSGRLPVTIGPYPAGIAVSYDSANNLKRVQWDFGDGKTSKDSETEHAYAAPGNYKVTLTVTERNGQSVSERFDVIVE